MRLVTILGKESISFTVTALRHHHVLASKEIWKISIMLDAYDMRAELEDLWSMPCSSVQALLR